MAALKLRNFRDCRYHFDCAIAHESQSSEMNSLTMKEKIQVSIFHYALNDMKSNHTSKLARVVVCAHGVRYYPSPENSLCVMKAASGFDDQEWSILTHILHLDVKLIRKAEEVRQQRESKALYEHM